MNLHNETPDTLHFVSPLQPCKLWTLRAGQAVSRGMHASLLQRVEEA
jgi:hypothetical protein